MISRINPVHNPCLCSFPVSTMARLPRLYAPGVPQLMHAGFARPLAAVGAPVPAGLFNMLTDWLGAGALRQRVAVHGWVLLMDRIVLLATPSDAVGLPALVQSLGRNLAARLRSGRIFSGRYRSTVVEPGTWVLPALLWLETLPQQLEVTSDPTIWPWSSAALHIGASSCACLAWMQDHADYWACGNTPFERQAHYQRCLQDGLSRAQIQRIEQAILGQWALGEPAFIASLAHIANRRAMPRQRGRPPKNGSAR